MLRGVAGIAIAFFAGQALGAGALAVDTNQGARWGVSHSYANMNGAEQRALKECGSGCSIVLRFSTGCGAYAADQARGSTVYGWATAPSQSAAQNRALQECQQRGGGRANCIVRAWACNATK